ncbi:MAG: MBOAT family protein, partial [Oscillospiraceae bacterium]|nr:MBOAT family protein [Oscillospiraceae bacterium]
VFYPVMLSKPITSLSKKFRQRYGSHAGKMVPSVAAPMVVFFLIGIWHGLTWQYIVNGLYNAILISSTVALTPLYKKLTEKLHINTESFGFRLFQMLRTFCLLCISRIIVKAPGLREALRMIKLLFTSADFSLFIGSGGQLLDYGLQKRECLLLAAAIFLLFIVGVLQERGVKIRETLSKQCLVIRWGVLLGMLFVILVFGVYGPAYNASSFIYEAF